MGDIGQPGGAFCGQMGAQVGNLASFSGSLAAMWEPLASQFLQIWQLLSVFWACLSWASFFTIFWKGKGWLWVVKTCCFCWRGHQNQHFHKMGSGSISGHFLAPFSIDFGALGAILATYWRSVAGLGGKDGPEGSMERATGPPGPSPWKEKQMESIHWKDTIGGQPLTRRDPCYAGSADIGKSFVIY